jgi:hypothetical protein
MEQYLGGISKAGIGAEELDGTLCLIVATAPNMKVVVEELHDALESDF